MKILSIIFLLSITVSQAQYRHSYIDTLYSFVPGSGQNNGQEEEYFPMNIFGPPDSNASDNVPANAPDKVCSIGLGGEIIVGFTNFIVKDGPGPDFTIFENAFLNPVTSNIFAEPAVVSVSQDGIDYYQFPFDSLTLEGCAGTRATFGNEDNFDPAKGGGNSFDIGNLGLSYIKFIKITDICSMILNNPDHPFYDPIISGFDLDAVAGINLEEESSSVLLDDDVDGIFDIKFEKDNVFIRSNSQGSSEISYFLFSIDGSLITKGRFDYSGSINMSSLSYGLYILKLVNGSNIFHRKILKI